MARKRYDGLKALLGGSGLTASATSVTFAAPLTYLGSAAVAVPTLGANDYVPLGILDVNGICCEVVWLTAYTSGGTTGTISRNVEGSTGITHNAGDAVVCAGSARDLAYAGPRYDNPDDPLWLPANALDLEFDEDDTSGTLPSGWSWVNQGTSTYLQKFGAALVTPQTSSPDNWRLLTRALPAGSTWEAVAKMPFVANPTSWTRYAMVLRDSTNNKFTAFGRAGGGGWVTGETFINDWNSVTSFSGGESHILTGDPNYLKIKKNASTWDFLCSTDGISWYPFLTGKTAFSTYDQIGFGFHTNTATQGQAIHWFRVR